MKAPSTGWTSLLAQTNCAAVVGRAELVYSRLMARSMTTTAAPSRA